MVTHLLSLVVFTPILGALIVALVPKSNQITLKFAGLLATIPPLVLSILIFVLHRTGTSFSAFSYTTEWFSFGKNFSVDYQMSLNGFSMIMILLTSFLSFLAAMASAKVENELKGYFQLFLLLETGMLGVFAAGNMILFFLFFEATLVSAFFLVGKWGYEHKEKAAFQFLVYNGLGSAILLFVIMTLEAKLGTTNIQYLIDNVSKTHELSDHLKTVLLIGILVAFSIKLPSLPFHSWMLKMHTQAPPPVVMLHAGVLLKIGAYGLIRFGIQVFPAQFHEIGHFVAIVGVINVLFGAFLALIQTDLKLVLAYSSISHMGFVFMGLGAMNTVGFQGAIFQLVSHGLISALLFLLVGVLYDRVQTTELSRLGGLAKEAPIFGGILLLGTMALLGLPGLSGFPSELMALMGLFKAHKYAASISTIGLILTAAYALNTTLKITFGEVKMPNGISQFRDLKRIEMFPAVCLVTLIVLIGVMPSVVGNHLQDFISTLMNGNVR